MFALSNAILDHDNNLIHTFCGEYVSGITDVVMTSGSCSWTLDHLTGNLSTLCCYL